MSNSLRAAVRPAVAQARVGRAWMRGLLGAAAGRPNEVRVSYGHPRLPRPNEPALGGIVKLQSLSREFPNSPYRYNVLYLVTSRLPDGAVELATWAKRKGARVVINQNGVAYPAWYGAGWEQVNAPMRQLLALADHVFYQSAFCKTTADRFVVPPTSPWQVLHNAVDTAVFSPTPRAAGPLTLLLGGSQDSWYRFDSAVRTLAELRRRGRDAHLIVTGRFGWTRNPAEGEARAQALVAELGLVDRITLTGRYTQIEAPAIYRRADILIHTKYNDPCPSVVVEAMASGLPVVYSASGGVPELVGDAGVGVPAETNFERELPPDPVALADAVEQVEGDRAMFASRARTRAVAHLNLEGWLARHRAVFRTCQ